MSPARARLLQRSQHRFTGASRWTKFALAFLVLVVVIVGVVLLWEARRAALREAYTTAGNLAGLLAQQTETALKTTDLALQAAKMRLEREHPPQDDADFRAYLRMMNARLDYVRALYVIGPDGYVIHDTDYPDTPRISLADRSYFSVPRETRESLHIGQPVRSRSLFRRFVPVVRRVDSADGAFAGVVAAAVEPLFFERTYSRLQLRENDAIALFHADSTLIARVPQHPDLYGRKLKEFVLFKEQLPQAASGVYEIRSTTTGRAVIIGYERLAGFPLIVTAMIDRDGALAGWRRLIVVTALTCLTIIALAFLLYLLLERRRQELRFAQERALMHEKLESIGLMTSNVAHDFKNLLGAIHSGVQMVRRRGPNETMLAAIEEAIDRGSRLTADLLRFAKDQDIERRTVNPNAQIEHLATLLRETTRPGIRLRFDLVPDVQPINVSPALFDASVVNLAVNASQAMPHGGELRISTRNEYLEHDALLPAGDYAVISVADTGQGIPPDRLERIFEPFVTSKGGEGSGLGLFQVRAFVTEAGGDVRVASEIGKGSKFEILLPSAAIGSPPLQSGVPLPH